LDTAVVIPKRILACRGEGLVALVGNTARSVERNVLAPMRAMWGEKLVGAVRTTDGMVEVFGKRCVVAGADNAARAAKLQGVSLEYCYGDEMTLWNREFFEMLKSRLRTPNSCFDGTCNPSHPGHFVKAFLDSGAEVYCQHYTLDDNPFLSGDFVENLKREYAGTVYYERFVLGRWRRAEGAIYRPFADEPERWRLRGPKTGTKAKAMRDGLYDFIQVGVDFGGNKSAFAFVACGLKQDGSRLAALASERHPAMGVTPERMYGLLEKFIARVQKKYGEVRMVCADSAEQTLINGLRGRLAMPVRNSLKAPILDRVRATVALMGAGGGGKEAGNGRFVYTEDCDTLRDALCSAVWDENKATDTRLDDGSCDIDTLDAFEYSWERHLRGYARYRHAGDAGGDGRGSV
jgi:PBSX family phage terminase large subunit